MAVERGAGGGRREEMRSKDACRQKEDWETDEGVERMIKRAPHKCVRCVCEGRGVGGGRLQ